jgi:putative lipoprotein
MRKSIHTASLGRLAVAFSFVFLLHACGAVVDDDQVMQTRASETAQTFVFTCTDEYKFVARIEADEAWLFLPTGTLAAQKAPDGTYRTTDFSIRLEGQEAQLESQGGRRLSCRNDRRQAIWEHAKLNGADFRTIGNEPGWNLEIRNQSKLVLITGYGSEWHEFDLPESETDTAAKMTRYEIVENGKHLLLTITGEPCRDTMSGEAFASKVEIVLNGNPLHGCGRALH